MNFKAVAQLQLGPGADALTLDQRGLEMLQCDGVGAFNALRRKNPEWKPNFSRANLPGEELVLLYEANLAGVNLAGANLREVWMIEVDLTNADLREADLSGAVVLAPKLNGADLRGIKDHATIGLTEL